MDALYTTKINQLLSVFQKQLHSPEILNQTLHVVLILTPEIVSLHNLIEVTNELNLISWISTLTSALKLLVVNVIRVG